MSRHRRLKWSIFEALADYLQAELGDYLQTEHDLDAFAPYGNNHWCIVLEGVASIGMEVYPVVVRRMIIDTPLDRQGFLRVCFHLTGLNVGNTTISQNFELADPNVFEQITKFIVETSGKRQLFQEGNIKTG